MPTLAEAICKKYVDTEKESDSNGDHFVIFAPKSGIKQCVPHLLVINSSDVDCAGDPEVLSKYISNVLEIDVSRNRITDISQVAEILAHSSKLTFLNIGFNNLSLSSVPAWDKFPVVNALSNLILIGTNASWQMVWFLIQHAPNVSELHLSLNNYQSVLLHEENNGEDDTCPRVFVTVKKLMFDGNPVVSWTEISKLGVAFPNLELLSLTKCPIKNIPLEAAHNFNSLTTLWLSHTLVCDQQNVENLKSFGLLKDLRINGIPFLQDFPEDTRRQHIIALLPNIEILNRGRPVSQDERETAERSFIRYYMEKPDRPLRYDELVKKHGEVHKLANVRLKPLNKLNLTIMYENKELTRIDVNMKQTVKDLKNFLEPIVGISATSMDLYYVHIEDCNCGADIMKYPNKQLYTYNMDAHDEIHVHKKKNS